MTADDAKRLQESGVALQELDWNAVYADQLPRIYNYFRFRAGRSHCAAAADQPRGHSVTERIQRVAGRLHVGWCRAADDLQHPLRSSCGSELKGFKDALQRTSKYFS